MYTSRRTPPCVPPHVSPFWHYLVNAQYRSKDPLHPHLERLAHSRHRSPKGGCYICEGRPALARIPLPSIAWGNPASRPTPTLPSQILPALAWNMNHKNTQPPWEGVASPSRQAETRSPWLGGFRWTIHPPLSPRGKRRNTGCFSHALLCNQLYGAYYHV
jgi:hypothetical protein